MRIHPLRYPDKYVLGFAFTASLPRRVALIEKLRPSAQAGKLNGIGGRRDEKENPADAMEREFFEETGVRIPASIWVKRGVLTQQNKWHVTVYTVAHPNVVNVTTTTDEEVVLTEVSALKEHLRPMLANLRVLVALCQMPPDSAGVVPQFTLAYP